MNDGVSPSACPPSELDFGLPTSRAAGRTEWTDWHWQMRNRIRSFAGPGRKLRVLDLSAGDQAAADRFPLAITPYYASLIRMPERTDPIFRMCVPSEEELSGPSFLSSDALREEENTVAPYLIQRYADRALLLATSNCACYCRYCTRKRATGREDRGVLGRAMRQVISYLRGHAEVREILVSGGDPLTMSTDELATVLSAIRDVPSVEVVRLCTKMPVVLPFRINDELVRMLRDFHPVWVSTHFNHPRELTPEAASACARLVDAGVPVNNQTVLLAGVNDNAGVLSDLFRGLVRMRVRPYYLFQCDLVSGVEHFRTPLARGISIMRELRAGLSGICIPTFAIDVPGHSGKVPLVPAEAISRGAATVFNASDGTRFVYPDPA
jgi:lysine 2,3-aminomutase